MIIDKLIDRILSSPLNPFFAQDSLPWGGTTTGDAGPYTDDQWSDTWRKLFTRNRATEGVLPDYQNELETTWPGGTTIRSASGAAIVDGKFYENDAAVNQSGAVPGAGSNFYRVVLEKDFVAQTVRLGLLGPDVSSPPAVTQVDGTTWEISLATVEITSGGTVTITDDRTYAHFNTEVNSAMLATSAVTTTKIADGAVTAVKLTDGAGSGVDADLLDGQQGSFYTNTATDVGASSNIVLTSTPTLIPGMTEVLAAGTYIVTASIPVEMSGTAGQFADMKIQAYLDGVLQFGEAHEQWDIPASARNVKTTLNYIWVITVTGSQTLEIRAAVESGATASVTTIWQIDKAWAMKVSG
jgi:hypothetical protein